MKHRLCYTFTDIFQILNITILCDIMRAVLGTGLEHRRALKSFTANCFITQAPLIGLLSLCIMLRKAKVIVLVMVT